MLRNDDSEIRDPRSQPFSIAGTADYYGSIALTEYAACRNSSSLMTDPLFTQELQQAENRMMEYGRQVNYYLDNKNKVTPRALAHTVCQGAWLNMVELTKLYGHAIGNSKRDDCVRVVEMTQAEVVLLGSVLAQFGRTYPNWEIPGLIADLTGIWHRYVEIFNVRFVARDGEADAMLALI